MSDVSKIKLIDGGSYDVKDAIARAQLPFIINSGAKNRLRIDSYRNQTTGSNVTFTWNESACTISAVNTSAAPKNTTYQMWVTVTESGLYTFTCGDESGLTEDNPNAPYDCYLWGTSAVIRDAKPLAQSVTNTEYVEAGTYRLDLRVHNGKTVNTVFKPMLRHAEIVDTTFVPYAPTNRELYEMILALQNNS